MPIERLKTQQLTAGERTDLEAALRDPARFHSDGKEVGLAAIILPVLLIPLEIVLLHEVRSSFRVYGDPEVPLEYFRTLFFLHPAMLWNPDFLQFAGAVVIPIAIVAIVVYGIRTRGRHGHAITSFGVVRIRGDTLRVLRYADMAETKIEERNRPRYQIITDELELRAKDGGSLVMYGFGLERRKALIDAHVSARVSRFRGA